MIFEVKHAVLGCGKEYKYKITSGDPMAKKITEMDAADIGYTDPNNDITRKAQLGQNRRPILTLQQVNKLKKIRATKKLEQMKRNELLSIMYGIPEPEAGGL
jgi:hypothetical protein